MHAVRPAGLVVVVAAITTVLTGCGSSGSTTPPPATLSWAPNPTASGLVKATAKSNAEGRKSQTKTPIWSFTLPDPGNPNVPSDQWPDASEVVTKQQLKAAFPDAGTVTSSGAQKLHYNGDQATPGPATAKDTQVTWNIALGDSSSPSTMTVDIRAFGADSKVTQAWTKNRDRVMQNQISTDTFYQQGTFGAKGLYLLQNNNASILISDGDMAGWIDLSFGAFYSLATNPVDAQNVLKTEVFPLIVRDISAHMPRRYAA